jgi:hypothetical protein
MHEFIANSVEGCQEAVSGGRFAKQETLFAGAESLDRIPPPDFGRLGSFESPTNYKVVVSPPVACS